MTKIFVACDPRREQPPIAGLQPASSSATSLNWWTRVTHTTLLPSRVFRTEGAVQGSPGPARLASAVLGPGTIMMLHAESVRQGQRFICRTRATNNARAPPRAALVERAGPGLTCTAPSVRKIVPFVNSGVGCANFRFGRNANILLRRIRSGQI